MSKGNQLLKDAIAEAKVLRETAMAQAKLVLEEAFTPQLQSILNAKLNEMEEDDEKVNENSEVDTSMEETLDLEALLAEADDEDEKGGEKEEETSKEDAGKENEEGDEEKDITEMSPEEVEDYIRQIAAEEFEKIEAGQGEEIPGEEGEEIDLDAELGAETPADDEEINLDEMLDETEDNDADDKIDENDINIDELLAEFGLSETDDMDADDMKENQPNLEEELAAALATIEELRSSLQESNLLNAKLLYMNKVFKGHNLTESQKVQIVKTFDKAESTKEAKLVYESLNSTLIKKETEKSTIKESLGFASKASGIIAGKTTNKVIETDVQVDRWAKLAGLK